VVVTSVTQKIFFEVAPDAVEVNVEWTLADVSET
jgi:hypothetical protein